MNRTRMAGFGAVLATGTPEEFRDFICAESVKFAKIIVEAGVKAAQ